MITCWIQKRLSVVNYLLQHCFSQFRGSFCDRYPQFSNTCSLAPRRLMWLLSAKITINCVEKFAKLSSAKLISLLICQTLISPNFFVVYSNLSWLLHIIIMVSGFTIKMHLNYRYFSYLFI